MLGWVIVKVHVVEEVGEVDSVDDDDDGMNDGMGWMIMIHKDEITYFFSP